MSFYQPSVPRPMSPWRLGSRERRARGGGSASGARADAPRFAHDQNTMYSRPGSPFGRRRPVFGGRIQPVGSRSMPTWRRIHAATAASRESYHQWSSTRMGFCALRSRRRPRPNRSAVTSHVGLVAGSRRAGRARASQEPFLKLAHPVRRPAVAMTVDMLLVRRRRVVVDVCSARCRAQSVESLGTAPVSRLRSPRRGRRPSGQSAVSHSMIHSPT